MPFKWVRLSSNHCAEGLFKSFEGKWGVFGFAVGLGLTLIPLAHAFIVVTPKNGGTVSVPPTVVFSQSPTGTPTPTTAVTSPNFYYYVQYAGFDPTIPAAQGFVLFNPFDIKSSAYPIDDGIRAAPATAGGVFDSTGSNYFEVSVTSNAKFSVSGTQTPVIFFVADAAGSATAHPAPIAYVNGVSCHDGTAGSGNCLARNQVNNGSNRFYAVKFLGQNSVVRIGFYPNDICDDAALLGVTVSGCTGSALTTPKTALNGGKTTLRLTFSAGIWDLASTNIVPAPAPSSVVDTMSLPANFNFQIDTPSFTCPTALLNDPSNPIYQPGDREILLNTSIFSVTTATGAAPASSLVVVGTKGSATPVTTADFNSQNDLVQTVSLGGSSISVPGFTNSTLDQDVYYRLSFFAQDETGIYAVPAASPACIVNDVATASIGGFLNPDLANKCFIATAAFGAAESPPVVLLREFRDQVLLQFRGGRAFVGWYYRWSPMAAEWLSSHPLARIPVVFLLLPFELVAWLVLHKSISFLVVGMGGFIVLCLVLGLSSGRLLQSRSRLDK